VDSASKFVVPEGRGVGWVGLAAPAGEYRFILDRSKGGRPRESQVEIRRIRERAPNWVMKKLILIFAPPLWWNPSGIGAMGEKKGGKKRNSQNSRVHLTVNHSMEKKAGFTLLSTFPYTSRQSHPVRVASRRRHFLCTDLQVK